MTTVNDTVSAQFGEVFESLSDITSRTRAWRLIQGSSTYSQASFQASTHYSK